MNCSKEFSITVVGGQNCPDWTSINWSPDDPFWTFSGDSFAGNGLGGGSTSGGNITHDTSPQGCDTCQVDWSWSTGAGGLARVRVREMPSMVIILNRQKGANDAGSETAGFTLSPGNHVLSLELTITGISTMNGSFNNNG